MRPGSTGGRDPAVGTARSPGQAGAGLRILVVDDEQDIRETLRDALELATGAQVDTAGEAVSALALMAQGRTYDIVFTDERLPGMLGSELAARMPRQAGPVVVLMSAYDAVRGEQAARRAGAHRFLPKPVNLRQLVDIVQELTARPRATPGPAGAARQAI